MADGSNAKCLPALRAAFPHTIPVMAGYLFLGFTYGVYMHVKGFSFVYPMLMAAAIYGGSLEFLAVEMLVSPFAPLQTFLAAFMIQARHLFYSIAMLDRYKGAGAKKPYLIFALTDETFAVLGSAVPPAGVDDGWFCFFITLLDQIYWVAGATLGGLAGGALPFNTEGLDFVMTAMFVCIFVDQCLKEKQHYSHLIGVGGALACLLLFGADGFLIPTMVCVLLLLTALRRPIAKAGEYE